MWLVAIVTVLSHNLQTSLSAAPGASLELVTADITKPNSFSAELFQGVQSVICCTAVTVSPKEGDTENRDKYKQVLRDLHHWQCFCLHGLGNLAVTACCYDLFCTQQAMNTSAATGQQAAGPTTVQMPNMSQNMFFLWQQQPLVNNRRLNSCTRCRTARTLTFLQCHLQCACHSYGTE